MGAGSIWGELARASSSTISKAKWCRPRVPLCVASAAAIMRASTGADACASKDFSKERIATVLHVPCVVCAALDACRCSSLS